jgi:hypothetical protein
MKEAVETYLRKRFVALHGEGEAQQADVYRCTTCGTLITWKKIRTGDVCCQGHLAPATPTWMETIRLLIA